MFPFLAFDSGWVQISFTVPRYHQYYLYDIKKNSIQSTVSYEIKYLWIHIFHETRWAPTSQLLILLIRVWRMVTGCLYCNLLLTTGFLQIKRKTSHKTKSSSITCNLQEMQISIWLMQLTVFKSKIFLTFLKWGIPNLRC